MERTFGPTDARLRQQIQATDAETLLAWSERILTAETPEAVFHSALPPAEAQQVMLRHPRRLAARTRAADPARLLPRPGDHQRLSCPDQAQSTARNRRHRRCRQRRWCCLAASDTRQTRAS
ncbi:MAG: hypothetical protein K9L32_02125 [Chromatiaceae bacterium]|nr:hypothetical protein [Chromatiaceae bacterium]